jgi:hypothetical protein
MQAQAFASTVRFAMGGDPSNCFQPPIQTDYALATACAASKHTAVSLPRGLRGATAPSKGMRVPSTSTPHTCTNAIEEAYYGFLSLRVPHCVGGPLDWGNVEWLWRLERLEQRDALAVSVASEKRGDGWHAPRRVGLWLLIRAHEHTKSVQDTELETLLNAFATLCSAHISLVGDDVKDRGARASPIGSTVRFSVACGVDVATRLRVTFDESAAEEMIDASAHAALLVTWTGADAQEAAVLAPIRSDTFQTNVDGSVTVAGGECDECGECREASLASALRTLAVEASRGETMVPCIRWGAAIAADRRTPVEAPLPVEFLVPIFPGAADDDPVGVQGRYASALTWADAHAEAAQLFFDGLVEAEVLKRLRVPDSICSAQDLEKAPLVDTGRMVRLYPWNALLHERARNFQQVDGSDHDHHTLLTSQRVFHEQAQPACVLCKRGMVERATRLLENAKPHFGLLNDTELLQVQVHLATVVVHSVSLRASVSRWGKRFVGAINEAPLRDARVLVRQHQLVPLHNQLLGLTNDGQFVITSSGVDGFCVQELPYQTFVPSDRSCGAAARVALAQLQGFADACTRMRFEYDELDAQQAASEGARVALLTRHAQQGETRLRVFMVQPEDATTSPRKRRATDWRAHASAAKAVCGSEAAYVGELVMACARREAEDARSKDARAEDDEHADADAKRARATTHFSLALRRLCGSEATMSDALDRAATCIEEFVRTRATAPEVMRLRALERHLAEPLQLFSGE